MRTSGDGGRGWPRVASPRECGPRGMGTRPGGKGGRKRKEKKIGKRNEEKENGEREREKGKRRGAVRASGDRGRGRPRVACGPREVGHAVGGEREKEGAGFAAAGHDASRWMGKRWDVN